jgi:hypothetical protein
VTRVLVGVTAALLSTLATATLLAQSEFLVTVRAANVRQRPTTSAPVITAVPQGTRLTVVASARRWVEVEIVDRHGETTKGFILGTLGTVEAAADPQPAVVDPPAAEPEPEPIPSRSIAVYEPPRRTSTAVPPPPARKEPSTKPLTFPRISVVGGVLAQSGVAGALVGLGALGSPFANDQISIGIDGQWLQFEGDAGFAGSVNVLYGFKATDVLFTPIAGLGVPVIHHGNGTEVGAQMIFGLTGLRAGRQKVGGQVRISFVHGGPSAVVLADVSVNRR